MTDLLLVVMAYLLGSLPFGVWIGRALTGRDIRASGSGHSGATNTMRQAGWAAGILVFLLDMAKGGLATGVAAQWGHVPWLPAAAAGAVVAGHCWPILAGYRGGMGLATAGGAILVLSGMAFVTGIGLAAAGSLALRHTARGNAVGGALFGPLTYLLFGDPVLALTAAAVGFVVAVRAASDWKRVYRELWLDRGPSVAKAPSGPHDRD